MPSTTKRVVCLANSRKYNGRCIAGKEISSGGRVGSWIRPVSSRPSEEVPEYACKYEDGSNLALLDIVEVSLLRACPKNYQQENWLLSPNFYWKKVGRVNRYGLRGLTDPVSPLWINGNSSYNGTNDRISGMEIDSVTDSLRFIRLRELELEVYSPGAAFGNLKRRVQGHFHYGGDDYSFWVTDLEYEQKYLEKPDGTYSVGDCFLTISLGEPHRDGYSYKLIAAIIEPD